MATQIENRTTPRTPRTVLASLPVLIVVLSLLSLVLKNHQDLRQHSDKSHVQLMMAKQSAWLNHHPVLLTVSQLNIAGVPGTFLTDTCWHLLKTFSAHPHSQTRVSKDTTWL